MSGGSLTPTDTVPKTKEYLASLVPPDKDGFERIAHAQAEKEGAARRRAKEQKRKSLSSANSHDARADAALVIQKTFRGYRARREMQGFSLDATTRWVTAIREAQFRQSTKPRVRVGAEVLALNNPIDKQPSSARMNWKKASLVARRAGHDDVSSNSSSQSSLEDLSPEARAEARRIRDKANTERRQAARMMDLQYFLEMVDSKHRYGSNLRMYHEEWKKSDTAENFFYWLDYGQGKHIQLDTCPRDRLEREQVRYLSREERHYYLARVDTEGRLCWARTGARIDTTEEYKDSIHGIVPADDPTPAFNPATYPPPADSDDGVSDTSSESSVESRREADRAAKYVDAGPGSDEADGLKHVAHISASTIFNKLLRKSVRKNTWIFVADTSFRLYVGIKDSGAFQHSSFLQGSRISAAGLIKIKNGRLSSLSPLTGHYRPPASNFRAFVRSLKDTGVDMSHVSISKSYTVLVGLETYIKTRRKGKDLLGKLVRRRDKILAPEAVRQRDEEERDKSESAGRERRALERERREEEAASAELSMGDKVVEKLKSIPTHVKSQDDKVKVDVV
ncbi:hypothetical protein TOPH_04351 [Tolypocladium ophioglossoides CBS 100239]|uniref:IQ domain-containing protein IQM6 n=1 Tax=Tolypocladium ophioglossoides (strain CBS 100239) TaxID=1163406 RepID=A0A0L0NAG9_TOLOC|nr:hypothetical protein TOPH_04351 [Tolypocladium ophioglossoides CBS 100239]